MIEIPKSLLRRPQVMAPEPVVVAPALVHMPKVQVDCGHKKQKSGYCKACAQIEYRKREEVRKKDVERATAYKLRNREKVRIWAERGRIRKPRGLRLLLRNLRRLDNAISYTVRRRGIGRASGGGGDGVIEQHY